MGGKKIIDYVVVSGKENEVSFLNRVHTTVVSIETQIKKNEATITHKKRNLETITYLFNEFEKFSNLAVGKAYATPSYKELSAFNLKSGVFKNNDSRFKHPLKRIVGSTETTMTAHLHKEIIKSFEEITDILKDYQINLQKKIEEKNMLETELSELIKSPNPIVNKSIRTHFENEVQELIKVGYQLQGGVSASRGYLNQAMIKYED